ncbi:ApeI family dehydratase [Enterovibrio coralii]|uniref:AMP-dependent synthetase/ligase domain-containing protein n=1 Tax=Enterovibrio coralii TaxID=294935 RepID=A0A135I424_9GAMM|nr:AMP-binding protein [Enterovibrio coralii]KXF80175.1 hypothetical protein ATN88_22825 [Enterovibrio coralii]
MGLPSFSQLLAVSTDHHVVADAENALMWPEFRRDVTAAYHVLCRDNHERWALCLDDSYHMAVAFLALAHAGKTLVVPGNLRPAALNELSDMFDGIVTDTAGIHVEGKPNLTLPLVNSLLEGDVLPEIDDAKTQLILYTSGSSGTPKAIVKTLHQLYVELETLENTWGETLGSSAIVSTVSHQHIYGLLFRVLWPLFAFRPFSRDNIDYIQHSTSSLDVPLTLISSPAQLKRLNPVDPAFQCQAVFSSGGPLPFAAAKLSLELLGVLPYEVFGSTETGGIAHRQQATETTPWQVFAGIEPSTNQDGCLCIRSPYIDPNSVYETADLCDLDADGRFLLKGRADRIVKIEEKRVSLSDVETRLLQHPWVSDAACAALDNDGRQFIAAALVLNSEGLAKLQSNNEHALRLNIRKFLTQWLDNVAIPRRFEWVGEIPQNSQGKRQRQIIEGLFTETSAPLHMPRVVQTDISQDRATLHLVVEKTLAEFKGHFPGFPIYPGVSQIDDAIRFAKDIFPISGQFSSIDKLKFEAPVWPGMQLTLSMDWHTDTQKLSFKYESAQGAHTRGMVKFI